MRNRPALGPRTWRGVLALAVVTVTVGLARVQPEQEQVADVAHDMTLWEGGGAPGFAKVLKQRLDELSGLEGQQLLFGWAVLAREFGLTYDGYLLTVRERFVPCGYGWQIDIPESSEDQWTVQNAVVTAEKVASGKLGIDVVTIPKGKFIRYVTREGITSTPPTPDELGEAVLFIGQGEQALIADMRSGDYFRVPFDLPALPEKGTPSFRGRASTPSGFWK